MGAFASSKLRVVTGMRETALIRTRLSTFFNAFAGLSGPRDGGAASKGVTCGEASSPSTPGVLCSMGPALGGIGDEDHLIDRNERLVLSALACLTPASAMDEHTVLTPNDVKWGPAPASIPKGAQAAAIYGDASKEGLFALRLKLPKGYHIPPHTHPKPELVTIFLGHCV